MDPLFYRGRTSLEQLARADFRFTFQRMRAVPDRFVSRTYASIDEAEARRAAGLERFLGDYASGVVEGRYRVGALPCLGFPDRAFDLVLCGHLLFLYKDLLDYDFHLAALRERCRVTRREARVHPVVDDRSGGYERLGDLLDEADRLGFEARVVAVEHEFFLGSNRTLVLRRREP